MLRTTDTQPASTHPSPTSPVGDASRTLYTIEIVLETGEIAYRTAKNGIISRESVLSDPRNAALVKTFESESRARGVLTRGTYATHRRDCCKVVVVDFLPGAQREASK